MGKNGNFYISIVKAHIGRSSGRSTPWWRHLVGKNGNFYISIVKAHIGRSSGRSTPIDASSGQEWQFYISIVKAHIGRSSGRSTPHRVQGIMGCILWDVSGSHCGFFKKRWEFAFISE